MFKKPTTSHTSTSFPAQSTQASPAAVDGDRLSTIDASENTSSTAPSTSVSTTAGDYVNDASLQVDNEKKRKSSDLSAAKIVKRPKTTTSNGTTTTKTELSKGQQSLKGFFAPKTNPAANNSGQKAKSPEFAATEGFGKISQTASPKKDVADVMEDQEWSQNVSFHSPARSTRQNEQSAVSPLRKVGSQASTAPEPPPPPSPSACSTDGFVHDPIVSKESWSTLFRKPAAPLCEGHSEPCKSMLTKKKGENQGRSFWMCKRPLGPSGVKEKGSQWRCPTFVWCSDWKGDA